MTLAETVTAAIVYSTAANKLTPADVRLLTEAIVLAISKQNLK